MRRQSTATEIQVWQVATLHVTTEAMMQHRGHRIIKCLGIGESPLLVRNGMCSNVQKALTRRQRYSIISACGMLKALLRNASEGAA